MAGNKIPDTAYAVPLTLNVCGRSAQMAPVGPPEHFSVTLPLNLLTDWSSRMNPARMPPLIVSDPGMGVIVKLAAGANTVTFCEAWADA